jgi:hypothetical protein
MRVALARDGGTTVLELSPSAAPPYVVVSVPAATAATAASAGTASVGTASAGDAAVERQGQEPQAAAGEVSSGVTAGAGAAAECVARVLDGVGDDADAGLELDAAAIVGRVLAALAQ